MDIFCVTSGGICQNGTLNNSETSKVFPTWTFDPKTSPPFGQTGVAFFCVAFSGSFAGNTCPQASNMGFDAASFGYLQASANQTHCGT